MSSRFVRLALIAIVVSLCSPFAFSNCLLVGVSNVLDNTDPTFHTTTLLTIDQTGYPALMAGGGKSELASGVLILDDGAFPNCFTANQVLQVIFNAPVVSPTSLSVINVTAYDSQQAGIIVAPSLQTSGGGSVATLNITRAGTAGNLTGTGTVGSAIFMHGFSFDVSGSSSGTVTASVLTSIGAASPTTVVIGQINQAGPLTFTPASVTFPDQIVGATGPAVPLSITNSGSLAATFPGGFSTTTSEFNQTNNCGNSLAAGATCVVNLTFTPAGTGTRVGQLVVGDNTKDNPHSINLAGNAFVSPGVPTVTSVSPSRVIAGGLALTITVKGTNYAQGSVVQVNGSARVSTFVDATTLTAQLSAADLASAGTLLIGVANGTQLSNSIPLQVQPNPIVNAAFTYTVPHITQGQGFITKLTLTNLQGLDNTLTVYYLNQDGSVASAPVYTIPAFGTLRLSTPESARFGPSITQWAIISSSSQLLVNSFLELTDSGGKKVLNSIGFNSAESLTDFTMPVEFEKTSAGVFTRTVGIALGNPTDTTATVNLQLVSSDGTRLGPPYAVTLNALGQTAIDLAQVPAIAAVLPVGNFVGSLAVSSKLPIASIGLGDDVGPFAATPVVTGRAYLGADDITSTCPLASQIAQFNRDFILSFEADSTAGTLVCRAAEGSVDLTQMQFRAYQALRVIKEANFDAQMPFAQGLSLYDWVRSAVQGIRFRGDIVSPSCCNPPRTMNLPMGGAQPAMQNNGWLAVQPAVAWSGLDNLVASIVQQARIGQGLSPTCVANNLNDNTMSEMGVWAAALDFSDFVAGHAGRFFDDTVSGDPLTRYRQVAFNNSNNMVLSNFCSLNPNVQTQPGNLDFGIQPQTTIPVTRTLVVNSAGTPFFVQQSSIAGPNAADFSIVYDTCTGNLVPVGCTLQIGFTATGSGARSATLTVGTPPNVNVALAGFASAATTQMPTPFVKALPHIVTGNGYVTKITLVNMASVPNLVYVRYFDQTGAILKTDTYTVAAAGTVRISTPESSRFGATTTTWALVGSSQPLLTNLFFEVMNSGGTIVNTVGFNDSPFIPNMIFPVEFEPTLAGAGNRTAGVAIANPTSGTVNYTITLVRADGGVVTSFPGSLAPYAQTSIDLSASTAFGSVLPNANFVGTVRITANGQLSVIALEGDRGPFSATPVVPQ